MKAEAHMTHINTSTSNLQDGQATEEKTRLFADKDEDRIEKTDPIWKAR